MEIFITMNIDVPVVLVLPHSTHNLRTSSSILHAWQWSKTDSMNFYKLPTRLAVVKTDFPNLYKPPTHFAESERVVYCTLGRRLTLNSQNFNTRTQRIQGNFKKKAENHTKAIYTDMTSQNTFHSMGCQLLV